MATRKATPPAGTASPNGAPRTWADIGAALKAGKIPGVPAGVDLEEFIWQTFPDARSEIETRNPGGKFSPAAWAKPDR